MQKLYTFLCLIFIIPNLLHSQGSDLCDGTRFIESTFEEVSVTKAVKYGVGVDVLGREFDLLMDVYEPAGDTAEDRPLVIMAHGGSFIFGTRENPYMVESCTEFAKRGYVAASISYSLWPLLAGIPDSIELLGVVVNAVGDMKTSIRYFRQDATTMTNEFRVDPNLIMTGGLSAGAIMAAQVGFMDEDDAKPDFLQDLIDANGGIDGDGDHQGFNSDPIGIINLSGGVYLTDWVDSDDIPVFSMHGTADETVPFLSGLAADIMSINGSGLIHPKCEEVGLLNQIIIVEGGGHTDIYTEPMFADQQALLADQLYPFLEDILCNYVVSSQDLIGVQTDVFPNPSSDFIQIELGIEHTEAYDFLVFDRAGKVIYRLDNASGNKISINKDQIGSGYFYAHIRFKSHYAPITKAIVFE